MDIKYNRRNQINIEMHDNDSLRKRLVLSKKCLRKILENVREYP